MNFIGLIRKNADFEPNVGASLVNEHSLFNVIGNSLVKHNGVETGLIVGEDVELD